MRFTKMHGIGNDYLLTEDDHPDFGALARRWCDRHRAIGADGIIAIRRGEPLEMRVTNSDGSSAGMCGNGMRCVAFHAHARLGAPAEMSIRCGARTCGARVLSVERDIAMVELDLGEATTNVDAIRIDRAASTVDGHRVRFEQDGTAIEGFVTDVGNPHLVLLDAGLDPHAWGPRLATHRAFPGGINVMFLGSRPDGRFDLTPWERGAGPTSACGSGAVASAIALVEAGVLEKGTHEFLLPGGTLRVGVGGGVGVGVGIGVGTRATLRGEAAFAFDVTVRD